MGGIRSDAPVTLAVSWVLVTSGLPPRGKGSTGACLNEDGLSLLSAYT
jgi:hypothetical protein